jgi:cytochrome c oxidase subunit 1
MWNGRIRLTAPMLHLVGSLSTFVVGAYLVGVDVVLWLYNVVQSLRTGAVVTDADVWNLKETGQFTREWQWFERRLNERQSAVRTE